MKWDIVQIDETDSTNQWLRLHGQAGRVVVADYQTAGRGCGTNRWESERGKNLTFSLMLRPTGIRADEQFVLSMALSNAIRRTLQMLLWPEVEVKWPNDIYVDGEKICGVLIECQLAGGMVKDCIMGVGLNVNQERFVSDAPNPTSMLLVEDRGFDCRQVLSLLLQNFGDLMDSWEPEAIRAEYRQHLFRREGSHLYRDADGFFLATLTTVCDDGRLLLTDDGGHERVYAFKEVQFIL